ncbi:GNAT family N-acetyltransferase [Nonomuraea sp. NPDC052265]|uniref:GNAT family N-acetyltransferase n=1 Tax=Nonomuraea sp. NPDC052265 TaxID=3364374 RepID=UPI0037C55475
MAVAPEAVRGGLGRRLMAAAEEWARDQGLRHVTLETGAANTTARRFYAALGYTEEGVRLTRSLDRAVQARLS